MQKLISARLAGTLLLIGMGLLLIFHVLVLLSIVPPEIVWGGQAGTSPTNLLALEAVALIVTVLFAIIIAAKTGYIAAGRFQKIATIGVWVIFAYFVLNLIANLASGVSAEKLVFAPVTLILALCAVRLAIEPE
jgi:hypothetical protein